MTARERTYCLFDAFGTLIYPEPEAAQVYMDSGRRYGDQRSLVEIRRILSTSMENVFGPNAQSRSSQEREFESWKTVVQTVFGHLPRWRRLFEELWEHFAQPVHWRVYDDVVETIDELRRQGCEVGVASNFDARLHTICRGLFPRGAFAEVFTSAEVGWRKPARGFFQTIRERLGTPAEQLWMIGDQREIDTQPARVDGWRAVLLDRGQAEPFRELDDDTIRIRSLAQLPRLLLS